MSTYVPILNLLIPQGSDLDDLSFQLKHKTTTRCPVSPSTTTATIKIEQMGVMMLAGEKLSVGCDDLTLASNLNPTDRVVSVTSIPSSIPNGSLVVGKPIDITGWSFRGSLKTQSGTLLSSFTCVNSDPTNGIFKVTLSNSITQSIAANCIWRDYQGIDIKYLGQPLDSLKDILSTEALKRLKKLNEVAYKWDVESVDLESRVKRRAEGLVLVSGEVTT